MHRLGDANAIAVCCVLRVAGSGNRIRSYDSVEWRIRVRRISSYNETTNPVVSISFDCCSPVAFGQAHTYTFPLPHNWTKQNDCWQFNWYIKIWCFFLYKPTSVKRGLQNVIKYLVVEMDYLEIFSILWFMFSNYSDDEGWHTGYGVWLLYLLRVLNIKCIYELSQNGGFI